jgi:hypothetical protein
MFLLEDKVLCAFWVTLLICTSQLRVLWILKPRYLAKLTLFSICPWMIYLECSGVLVICRTLHLSGWSSISHWSSHFCNVCRSCCRVHHSSSDLILRYRLIIYRALGEGAITTCMYFKRLGLDAARAELELTTSCLLSEITNTRLWQPVKTYFTKANL